MKDEPNIPDEIKKMVAAGKFERPWIENTPSNPFWNNRGRVEVKYGDGSTDTLVSPSSARHLNDRVTHWRSVTILMPPKIKIGSILGGIGGGKPETPKPKIVPTVFKGGVIQVEWHRRFTKMERFKILFGANFIVMAGIACEHSAGKYQPLVVGEISKHTDASGHMREVISNMLVDKDSPVNKLVEES